MSRVRTQAACLRSAEQKPSQAGVNAMILKSVSIRREDDFYGSYKVDPTKPFVATIEVAGSSGQVKLNLSPVLSRRIVEIIADEVAAAGRATAEMMTAEAFDVVALPSPAAA